MKGLFKGNNAQLYKNVEFFIATYDTRTNAISRSWAQRNRHFRNAYMAMVNWAYNNIVRRENVRQEFIFAVKESGVPFYCSEEFTNQYCRRLIGYSLNAGWIEGHKKLIDLQLSASDKDYGYVAYVGRYEYGKGLQDVDRVPLTKDLRASQTAYKAMFAKDKDGKQKF